MNKDKIRKFREDNFKGKDSRKQWSIVSSIPVRTIKAFETGENPIPGWYSKLIFYYKIACNISDQ